ncbi:MAG: NUDIX domain-containing protein [Candidatus Vogelbacteria bacterium]|nr:NUDIX domain-containing protein [Candidatus Vogelbacteria bacterium]
MDIKDRELHRIVIMAIIYDKDGRYLITKRSPHKKVFPDKWTVPGGGLEVDDYINTPPTTEDGSWYNAVEKALRREVREEVNLEMGEVKYLLDLAFIRPDGIPVITLSYYAPYLSGEVKLDDDAVDFKWVTLAEAKNYDLIKGIWEEIELTEKILREQGVLK